MVSKQKNIKDIKILIFGGNGQIGKELKLSLKDFNNLTTLYKSKKQNPNFLTGNLYYSDKIVDTIKKINPKIIINSAAFTNVDKCEERIRYSNRINGIALRKISQYCFKKKILLIHFSTDYVYSGNKDGLNNEFDLTNPINQYGKSKLLAEKNIISSKCNYIIFRISWVLSNNGNNFLKKILEISKKMKKIYVVNDQWGSPTSAKLVAKTIRKIIFKHSHDQNIKEIYNLSCRGRTNWYEIAKFIISEYNKKRNKKITSLIFPCTTSSNKIAFKAKRPSNSKMNIDKITKRYNLNIPFWKDEVKLIISEI